MNRFELAISPNIDQVASSIRTRIINLHNLLDLIENTHRYDDDSVLSSLRESEVELRRLRRLISES
ncbi:MAG: hypothetical protein KBD53_01850 [Candidatus Omnitrophica bacterium]|nr:hypothetical protein [Candidatus Omnitrophota bacterium]